VTVESIRRLSHRILEGHAIRVDLRPYCQPERPVPGHTSTGNSQSWLGPRGSTEYTSLHETLTGEPSYVGIVPEVQRRILVAIFEPDFREWASIQERLSPSRRFPIELRPGCHTAQQRESAERVLQELQWERPWGAALHAWTPDASNAGFRVFVLPGEVEAERRIIGRLGWIADVWFARPFGAHDSKGASR